MTWQGAVCALALACSLGACDVDGVTPVCPEDAGSCITPPAATPGDDVAESDGGADDATVVDDGDGGAPAHP